MQIHYLEIVTREVEAETPGHGTFAIYLQGDIDHGLWQL